MTAVPQEIINTIVGFLVEDRATLLTCSLAGNRFYYPSRTHLFAEIEISSLQRFQGLLQLSTTSLGTSDLESLKTFSSVRTISLRDVDAWITPEYLPSLLFLPLLAPFSRVESFRIDGLTLPDIGVETLPMPQMLPLRTGGCIGVEMGPRLGIAAGVSIKGPFADRPNIPTASGLSAVSLRALTLGNCEAPSLRWLPRYVSYFPCLESLSLVDFMWRSIDREDAEQSLALQLSELTLEVQCTPFVASPPRLLFESLFGSLKILRLMHIDTFLSVGQLPIFWAGWRVLIQKMVLTDEDSIYLDRSYIDLSSLKSLTHLTLPPVAVWLQAKQRWLPDLLSTITSASSLEELNIHLLFSPVAIKAQLDCVAWPKVDLILGRNFGEEPELDGTGARGRRSGEGCVFTDLEAVNITSADFNPNRPPLDGHAKSRIEAWLIGYMSRIYNRRILRIPLDS